MVDVQRQKTLGLNTDLPPDRLGDQAFDLRNVVPRSVESAGPRDGCVLVDHYTSGSVGRQLVIDDLPYRSDGRKLVIALNTTSVAGSPSSRAAGVGVYAPRIVRTGALVTDAQGQTTPPWSTGGSDSLATFIVGFIL